MASEYIGRAGYGWQAVSHASSVWVMRLGSMAVE
jgi:hypothetical protein